MTRVGVVASGVDHIRIAGQYNRRRYERKRLLAQLARLVLVALSVGAMMFLAGRM